MDVFDYFRSAHAELKKVSWPSKKDIIRYSTLIISVSVIVAAFFAFLDSSLRTGVEKALARKRFVAPAEEPIKPKTVPDIKIAPVIDAVTSDGTKTKVNVIPLPNK